MLMTIINWILMGIAEGMDLFLGLFFRCFSLTPGAYLDYFPVLETSYKVFKGIGYGLVFVLAAVSLLKFFQPGLLGARSANDTPLGILFKTAVASGLIYAGNYVLEYIMYIATVPYNIFNGLGISNLYSNAGDVVENIFCQLVTSGLHDLFGAGLTAGAVIIELVIVLMIAYNFFKLVIEIAERYLIVGLMLFTSPPFFALSASADTTQSFKSWIKMFISANGMMFASVFSCKLVLSGIAGIATENTGKYSETFLRLLLILAMCKVAQHIDSYLKQLGLGTAETGGGLLEDILATGRMVGSMFSGARSGRQTGSHGQTVLGKAGAVAMGAGFLGSNYIAGGIGEIKRAVANGESPVLSKINAAGKKMSAQKSVEQESRVPILKMGKAAMKNPDVTNTVDNVRDVVSTGKTIAKGVAQSVAEDIDRSKPAAAAKKIHAAVGNNDYVDKAATGVKIAAAGARNIATSAPVKAVTGFYSDNIRQTASSAGRIASVLVPGLAAQKGVNIRAAKEDHKRAISESNKKYPVHTGAGMPLKVNENDLLNKIVSKESRISSSETRSFYNSRGIEKGYTLNENGEITPAPAALAAGMEYNEEERRLSNRNDAATAEFLNVTYGKGKYDTFDDTSTSYNDYSDGRETTEVESVKDVQIGNISEIGKNTINASSPALAETMAMDSRFELSGDDEVGSAMINKINGTQDVNYTDVTTQNMPSYTDDEGNIFKGGHIVSAKYIDSHGNLMSYSAVNEAGFDQLTLQNPDIAATYDKVEGKSGISYYEKNELIATGGFNSPEMAAENSYVGSNFTPDPSGTYDHIESESVQEDQKLKSINDSVPPAVHEVGNDEAAPVDTQAAMSAEPVSYDMNKVIPPETSSINADLKKTATPFSPDISDNIISEVPSVNPTEERFAAPESEIKNKSNAHEMSLPNTLTEGIETPVSPDVQNATPPEKVSGNTPVNISSIPQSKVTHIINTPEILQKETHRIDPIESVHPSVYEAKTHEVPAAIAAAEGSSVSESREMQDRVKFKSSSSNISAEGSDTSFSPSVNDDKRTYESVPLGMPDTSGGSIKTPISAMKHETNASEVSVNDEVERGPSPSDSKETMKNVISDPDRINISNGGSTVPVPTEPLEEQSVEEGSDYMSGENSLEEVRSKKEQTPSADQKSSISVIPSDDIADSEFSDDIPYPEAEKRRRTTQTADITYFGYNTDNYKNSHYDVYDGEDYHPDGEQIPRNNSNHPIVIDPTTEFLDQGQPFVVNDMEDSQSNIGVSGQRSSNHDLEYNSPNRSNNTSDEETTLFTGPVSEGYNHDDNDRISANIHSSKDPMTHVPENHSGDSSHSGVHINSVRNETPSSADSFGDHTILRDVLNSSYEIERAYTDSQAKIEELENKLKNTGIIAGQKLNNIHEYAKAGATAWTVDGIDAIGNKVRYTGVSQDIWKTLAEKEKPMFTPVKDPIKNETLYITATKSSGEKYAPQIKKISDKISSHIPPKATGKGPGKGRIYGDYHMIFSGGKNRQNRK